MVIRNAGVPADERIAFRVGVHLGDVVEEADGDLMGDGVNIASRLEGLSEPGGLCLVRIRSAHGLAAGGGPRQTATPRHVNMLAGR
jgi:class 3 adenylate cyclase